MTPVVVIPARGGNDLSKPLDSGLRRNDDKGGFLGGLFQTPLYHLHPCKRTRAYPRPA